MRERFAAGGKETEGGRANCTALRAVHRGAPQRRKSLRPHQTEKGNTPGLEGGGAHVRERFAAGRKGNGRRESKLHQPCGLRIGAHQAESIGSVLRQ